MVITNFGSNFLKVSSDFADFGSRENVKTFKYIHSGIYLGIYLSYLGK